jgi:mRNA-degrading endonuclease RelE of RelBE toxin-antitoxin system
MNSSWRIQTTKEVDKFIERNNIYKKDIMKKFKEILDDLNDNSNNEDDSTFIIFKNHDIKKLEGYGDNFYRLRIGK